MYRKPSSAMTRAHAVPIPPLPPTIHAVPLVKVVHQARRTVTALECSPRDELRHPRSNGFCHGEPGSMELRPERFERVARRLYRSLGSGDSSWASRIPRPSFSSSTRLLVTCHSTAQRAPDASDGAGSPWLVLVREPDQLGVERTHPQLAFGVRLVELAEPNRHVAADHDRTPASLNDDYLRPRVWPGAGRSRSPGSSSSSPSTGTYRTPGASTHSRMV